MLLEWEEVYEDMFYGTLNSEVERIWTNGKQVIFDVDVVAESTLKHFSVQPFPCGSIMKGIEKSIEGRKLLKFTKR